MTEWMATYLLGMPQLAASTGEKVDALIVWVHLLMFALFVGWVGYFCYAIWRFNCKRNPKADYEGVKNHISNYIELIVAGVEAILLCGVAIPVWAKAVDEFPAAKDSTVVYVMAQQYAWNVRYAGADGVFGRQDMKYITEGNVFGVDPNDPNGKDDIQLLNDIHVPVNKPVIVYVSSKDVIHSFKLAAMRVCQDAIPGLRIPLWFIPTQVGKYQINCAQLCGPGHSAMTGGMVTVESQADYDKWIQSKTPAPVSTSGKSVYE
ncbi:MAG TPA: cytochrome c oxidase subunit II [Verrucomicrobiae bacterium]|jgi:cytochrome c oxidase subunit 2